MSYAGVAFRSQGVAQNGKTGRRAFASRPTSRTPSEHSPFAGLLAFYCIADAAGEIRPGDTLQLWSAALIGAITPDQHRHRGRRKRPGPGASDGAQIGLARTPLLASGRG